jgi:hypothetical protein
MTHSGASLYAFFSYLKYQSERVKRHQAGAMVTSMQ